jgi:hypothetical protein
MSDQAIYLIGLIGVGGDDFGGIPMLAFWQSRCSVNLHFLPCP